MLLVALLAVPLVGATLLLRAGGRAATVVHGVTALGTVGLAPLARGLHLIEDFLESSLEAAALPPLGGVQSFLLSMQADVRRQLAQCKKGYIETSPEKLRAALAALSSGAAAPGTLAVGASIRGDSPSRVGSRSGDSRELGSDDDVGPALSPQIRVAAERLDQLRGDFLLPCGVRAGLVGCRALEEAARWNSPHE